MRTKNWHRLSLAVLAALAVGPPRADAQSPEFAASFARATTVLYEMVNVPDGAGIPREVMARAHGIAVFPGVVKGAILIGGTSGDGVVTVRRPDGSWSPPAILRMSGGSLGRTDDDGRSLPRLSERQAGRLGVTKDQIVDLVLDRRSTRKILNAERQLKLYRLRIQ